MTTTVAESLGKNGQGILPNIEVDSLLLTEDPGDRSVIMYQTKTDLWDESRNFEMSLAYIDPNIPRQNYKIDSVMELAEHFVMWEYAIAMCGYLMQVCPMFSACKDLYETLTALFSSLQPGDYFALNAFLPFTGEGRREALETIRHRVASEFDVVSCLEVGPRYLHSTGQLQKGGPNCGASDAWSACICRTTPA